MNSFQTPTGLITPGDKVIAMTVSTGRLGTYIGTFLGWSESGNLQVEVDDVRGQVVHRETKEPARSGWWNEPAKEKEQYEYIKIPYKRICTLRNNKIFKASV